MNEEYVFDSASEPGRDQLDHLATLFDEPTTAFLDAVGVQPGWRCLDLGAGRGSIARWLADLAGPEGRVVAADIDTDHLVAGSGVEVTRHDVNDGVPGGGPFDLIHARLLLMHLKRREELLGELVEALAPGGWLVLGESGDRPQRVLNAPSAADQAVVDHVLRTGLHVVATASGVSWDWARLVEGSMIAAGLKNVDCVEYCSTIAGGTPGAGLYVSYVEQLEAPLIDAGITEDELRRFYEVMHDPRFRAWPFIQLVLTRGRKPLVIDEVPSGRVRDAIPA